MATSNINIRDYKDISCDSRAVKKNYIFVCIKGESADGHDYIEQAINLGAKLIVTEKDAIAQEELERLEKKYKHVNFLCVEDSKTELAKLAALLHNEPAKSLSMIGVTGTNGKTTVTHLIQHIINSKEKCPMLGTIGIKTEPDSEYIELANTTPAASEIQKILAQFVKSGAKYATMEVSSHALEQKRTAAIEYKAAIVTNLSQDHLDYHMTMDKYFEAKAKLFEQTSDYAVLNADDEYYERFLAKAKENSKLKIISYSVNKDSDLKAENLNFSDKGLSYEVNHKGERQQISSQLNGMFNVYNSLAAIACCLEEGFSLKEISDALKTAKPVAGRFEVVKNDKSPFCIIDYAHTPDGLENILKGARELLNNNGCGKLICLFGCGGDRDISKRPKMGKIAYDLSDFIYVSSDNPRTEDPDQIIADILTGIPNLENAKVIPDRAMAIKDAVLNAKPEDIVVIAGKGHEDYQILGTEKIHFDDKEQVEAAIKEL